MRQLIEVLINDIPFVKDNALVISLILFLIIATPIVSYVVYLFVDVLKADKK